MAKKGSLQRNIFTWGKHTANESARNDAGDRPLNHDAKDPEKGNSNGSELTGLHNTPVKALHGTHIAWATCRDIASRLAGFLMKNLKQKGLEFGLRWLTHIETSFRPFTSTATLRYQKSSWISNGPRRRQDSAIGASQWKETMKTQVRRLVQVSPFLSLSIPAKTQLP